MFMTDKEKQIIESLGGLIAPCDSELNVDSGGYTLKTGTLEDLVTASKFIRDAVDGKKNTPTPHIIVEVDTSRISELVREAQVCIDRAVEDVKIGLFTDGGTPQKKPVKIPEGKWTEFKAKLVNAAMKKHPLKHPLSCGWVSDSIKTTCYIEYSGKRYTGTVKKHPADIENEYIGKSLSFNRAFDKLECVVLKAKANREYGEAAQKLEEILHDGRVFFDVESTCRCMPDDAIIGYIAGNYIEKGDAVFLNTDGKMYASNPKPKTKSESMSDDTPIHDDITITMSRDEAEELYQTVMKTNGDLAVWSQLFNILV